MGELCKIELASGSDLGKLLEETRSKDGFLEVGPYIQLLKKYMEKEENKGILLDGYPRTVEQAKKMDDMLQEKGTKIECVVEFKVNEAIL